MWKPGYEGLTRVTCRFLTVQRGLVSQPPCCSRADCISDIDIEVYLMDCINLGNTNYLSISNTKV